MIRIRQIYYKDIHKYNLLETAIPYYNPSANEFLENQVIRDLIESGDCVGSDYYTVLSWKFKTKTFNRLSEKNFYFAEQFKPDVIGIWANVKPHNVWLQPIKLGWHPIEFLECGKYIIHKIYGIDVETLNTPVCYSNYQIVKSDIYEKYVKELLAPAMDLMSNDEYLREKLFVDAKYRTVTKGEIANTDTCLKVFGKPYYTLHPFVCERLFSTFASIHNLKIYNL